VSAPFHLSFCVADLAKTRAFYAGLLGCREGSSAPTHIDFAFYGNQLTCHVAPDRVRPASEVGLDGNHFGAILTTHAFIELEQRLRAADVAFLKTPEIQHPGTQRERRKMIFTDPSGNAIEIKAYSDTSSIFA
jgi:extradiol dioxygenase family protein